MTCNNCECDNCPDDCNCENCTPENCECKKEILKPQDDFGYQKKLNGNFNVVIALHADYFRM